MPPKSIFRQPGAKHFQLVHRSLRDPLIHDADASSHVLKAVVRDNEKKGKTRAELEEMLAVSEEGGPGRPNAGEASLYGVYYDDNEYDYMQHLRPVGIQEDGVDSVLIEAPATSTSKKPKEKKELRDLPQGVLPSAKEMPRTYESEQSIPDSIAGFRPDMDPHLRQTLEALENEAFVDDGLEDDFFGQLVGEGERGNDEVDFEFDEWGTDGSEPSNSQLQDEDDEDESWENRFAKFKKTAQAAPAHSDDGDEDTERGDTVSGLPPMSVIGGKRRKGSTVASGYSMSSSSMFRNEALQTLDERFDQMMLKQYDEDEESPLSDEDAEDDEAPELITTREDFESMMSEFLDNYEILGRKLKPKLEGETGVDKLNTLRQAMGNDPRVRQWIEDYDSDGPDDEELFAPFAPKEKERWDCETILSTYSNLENHPRLIRARNPRPVPQIVLDPKTGLPRVDNAVSSEPSEDEDDEPSRPKGVTISRPRDESPESKKARKAAVKAERADRRLEKKATKEEFGNEFKTQTRRGTTQRVKKL